MDFRIIEHGSKDYEESVALRDRVLRQPLGLTFSSEQLAAETDAKHVAGFFHAAIRACCILVDHGEGVYQVRQVAVDLQLQRQGYGARLMQFAEEHIVSLGGTTVFCHARHVAAVFYEQLGYAKTGDPFEEVGILHVQMNKSLATEE